MKVVKKNMKAMKKMEVMKAGLRHTPVHFKSFILFMTFMLPRQYTGALPRGF
jgi:hypothetical protein